MAVRDIGRKSLLRSSTGLVFGIGITSATFHCKGTRAWEIEALNIDAIRPAASDMDGKGPNGILGSHVEEHHTNLVREESADW